ncbi:hypothetical protein EDD15DRAFT_2532529 [Pisolithus albus]|nr:hypothetical protein EDD15DRAFT_2532529 [Pisolithus albus]
MSLASFLLGAGKKQRIDKELDGLLKSKVRDEDRPSSTPHVASSENQKKRKSKKHEEERKKKRSKQSDVEVNEETVAHDKKARKASRKVVEVDVEATKAESSKVARDSSLAKNGEDNDLVHETLRESDSSRQKGDGRKKYAPANETSEQRDARTIFIGNVPPEAAQERPLQKRLRQAYLNDASDDKKKARQHDRDRAASWREAHPDDDTPKTDEKKFLTPSQKKKIAFINHHIHSDADSVHAYIVFAYPKPPELRPPNLPPPPPVMDPFEAARLALEKCNGTMFMDRMLRVDAVRHSETSPSPNATAAATNLAVGDPKLTVFIGNLDFASKEDDLRVFFETLIHAERGPPPQDSDSDDTKHGTWVTRVRMIRDKDTQLGKGFAYVQFIDRSCVDEILALEPDRLKFAKRKLRVQRCKTIPSSVTAATSLSSKPSRIRTSSSAAPKGDPSLGQKLAHLSKEERKQAKAADADRRARRLAKKKARMALDKQGVRHQGQARERVRKSTAARKSDTARPRKTSKGRVRSEKSLSKRNAKK